MAPCTFRPYDALYLSLRGFSSPQWCLSRLQCCLSRLLSVPVPPLLNPDAPIIYLSSVAWAAVSATMPSSEVHPALLACCMYVEMGECQGLSCLFA